MAETVSFKDLPALAQHLRDELESKKFILLYAYNGVGKTRLSTEFKNLGKAADDENKRDTLYFNAFTEDLFTWDNDLEGDSERTLKLNADSKFFAGLEELEMDTRIRPLLNRYVDFDFRIDTDDWKVSFSRNITTGEGEDAKIETIDDIKVSRGEENIFIWCFFLSILQLVIDDDGAGPYNWVRYIYTLTIRFHLWTSTTPLSLQTIWCNYLEKHQISSERLFQPITIYSSMCCITNSEITSGARHRSMC